MNMTAVRANFQGHVKEGKKEEKSTLKAHHPQTNEKTQTNNKTKTKKQQQQNFQIKLV